MLELIKKHLADFSASKWVDYRTPLAADVVYEEMATQQRAKGPEAYILAVQRWKTAFPDLKATVTGGFVSGNQVIVEVEWEGTQTGAFAGPLGTIAPTNKKGRLNAVILFTLKDGKILESRHYFDLLTVLAQLGVSPIAPMLPSPGKTPGATPPRHS